MTIQAKLMALAINYINDVMETEYVYCFGVRNILQHTESVFSYPEMEERKSIHFDLLAVTSNLCPLPDFIGKLENIKDLDITLSLIVCTRSTLEIALKNNNRFYHSIIRKGKLVNIKPGNKPALPVPFDQKQNCDTTRKYWDDCYKQGMAGISAALNSYQDTDISIPLYKKSLMQICRGLIYVCLGYEPKGYSLEQLLELCNSIDLRINELFQAMSSQHIFHYKVLMQGYWKKNEAEDLEPYMDDIHRYCENFASYAKALCNSKLEIMANANHYQQLS